MSLGTEKITMKKAVCGLILMLTLVLALLVYPVRILRQDKVLAGSDCIHGASELVDDGHDVGAYVTAQYAHLKSAQIYIDSVEEGQRFFLQLFRLREDGGYQQIAQEWTFFPETLPGYAEVPLDVEVEPGDTLIFMMTPELSRYRVGLQDCQEERTLLLDSAFYHDTTLEGEALAMRLVYELPLGRTFSLGLLTLLLVLGGSCCAAAARFYQRHPEKNSTISVLTAVRAVLTPLILILMIAGSAAIWPLKLFDRRLPDILIFEAGILITGGILLYFLWKWAEEKELPRLNPESLRHLLISLCGAAAFQACCSYTNAVYELQHTLDRRKMFVWLFLMLLFTFPWKKLLSRRTGVCLVLGAAVGVIYYQRQKLLPDAVSAEEENTALRLLVLALVLLAALLVLMVSERKKLTSQRTFAPVGYMILPVLALFLLFTVFRNTKVWPAELSGFYLLFYLRFAQWDQRDSWLRDLGRAILLQFFFMMGKSLLHRYYLSFLYPRFCMDFMTATVTAVYLSLVEAAAMAFLFRGWKQQGQTPLRKRICEVFPQLTLFGIVTAYLILTLSRTGILTVIAEAIVLLLLVYGAELKKHFLPVVGVMLLMAAVVFPAVFTLQRIVPAMVQNPVTYGGEEMPDLTLRNHHLNAAYYMCIERFVQLFGNRILGLSDDWITYDNLIEEQYHPNGVGTLPEEEDEAFLNVLQLLASASEAQLPEQETEGSRAEADSTGEAVSQGNAAVSAGELNTQQGLDDGDYSNGRGVIFRIYLGQLNLTGHEAMGITLEDGTFLVHAHNVYLQVAYDFGIVTGLVFILFIILTFVRSALYYRRNTDRNGYTLLPAAILTAFTAAGMVEWVFQVCNLATVLLLLSIAPLLIADKERKTQSCIENI